METQAQISKPEPVVESDIEAFIPDFYIESDSERLDLYRRIYRVANEDELSSIRVELQDRFGEYPEEVENLLQLVSLRFLASQTGFQKLSLKGEMFTILLPDSSNEMFYEKDGDTDAPFQKIMSLVSQSNDKNVQLNNKGRELTLEFSRLLTGDAKRRLDSEKNKLAELTSSLLNS